MCTVRNVNVVQFAVILFTVCYFSIIGVDNVGWMHYTCGNRSTYVVIEIFISFLPKRRLN
jgi:hypothetical protein